MRKIITTILLTFIVVLSFGQNVAKLAQNANAGDYRAIHSKAQYFERKGQKDNAILWYKKGVDVWYNSHHDEGSSSTTALKKMGIEYHPLETNRLYEQDWKLASKYFVGMKYKKAARYYGRVLKVDKLNSNAYYNRGVCYYNLGKYKKSIKNLEDCLHYKPDAETRKMAKELLGMARDAKQQRAQQWGEALAVVAVGAAVAGASVYMATQMPAATPSLNNSAGVSPEQNLQQEFARMEQWVNQSAEQFSQQLQEDNAEKWKRDRIEAREVLRKQYGREPTDSELSEYLRAKWASEGEMYRQLNEAASSSSSSSNSSSSQSTQSSSSSSSSSDFCEWCNGSGRCYNYKDLNAAKTSCRGTGKCQYCNGTGYVVELGGVSHKCTACASDPGKCHWCKGTGKCHHCGGTGHK